MQKITYDDKNHIYHIDGVRVDSITQILGKEGLTDFSRVNPDILKRSQAFGDAVHLMTAFFDKHQLDMKSLDPALLPYLKAWKKFLRETKFQIESIEEIVASKRYMFAGRLDRSGLLNGKRTIVEIKSVSVMQKPTKLQTAGQEIAFNEGKKFNEKVKKRIAVQLKGNGDYNIEHYNDRIDISAFIAALTMINWKKINNIKEV